MLRSWMSLSPSIPAPPIIADRGRAPNFYYVLLLGRIETRLPSRISFNTPFRFSTTRTRPQVAVVSSSASPGYWSFERRCHGRYR